LISLLLASGFKYHKIVHKWQKRRNVSASLGIRHLCSSSRLVKIYADPVGKADYPTTRKHSSQSLLVVGLVDSRRGVF
jgi:hypothetical protein